MARRRQIRQTARREPRPWRDRLLALLLILALAWTQIQAFAHAGAFDPLLGLDICTTDDGEAGGPGSGAAHDCHDCCCGSVRDTAWLPPHEATPHRVLATDEPPAERPAARGPRARPHDRPLSRAPPKGV
ncbi:MAG: DUF2946 family protein [Rhodocyclaceae bacterium]|nr:DUF2946 family protein [Rhodocyclaceae bacterium]